MDMAGRGKKIGSVLVKLGLLGLLALMPTDPDMTQPVSVRMAVPAEAAAPEPELPEARQLPEPEPPAETAEAPESLPGAETPAAPEGPVDDAYFADAVFLGDSRTEGFSLYSGLETPVYLHAVGATVDSVQTKATEETEGGAVTLMDRLDGLEFSKVYIMLGVNELGWPKTEKFEERYSDIVERIQENHPDARVALQSILPVSAKQEKKGSYVNNRRIGEYNEVVRRVAEEKGCVYLDVAEAVTGEDGCLMAELTGDGIHLNTKGCRLWLEYLKENPI
ncbi:GDSL-type esterase/lipase family protein [Dysosmobacter sp.]|uniref:GDSL-type esterase/lipase family protein n=1 Tax=Dysosmobacter sp. TaxID=2591382 RepID=UPI002A8BDCCA|nr:GDSL-type esterase/lipase family protein [Dysosmobacter sp.]MDY3281744.1 GDSL-type esterase/lipase family protein [Dysosmobacter sp.]